MAGYHDNFHFNDTNKGHSLDIRIGYSLGIRIGYPFVMTMRHSLAISIVVSIICKKNTLFFVILEYNSIFAADKR